MSLLPATLEDADTIQRLKFDGYGPSCKLFCISLGNVFISWPAFEGDFFFFSIKSDKSKPCTIGIGVRICIGMHGNFIFKSIEITSRPWEDIIVIFTGHFVFGPPPSAVIIVNNGRDYKGPWAVLKGFYTVMNNSG